MRYVPFTPAVCRRALLAFILVSIALPWSPLHAVPPRYDHVVIVMEENENFTSVIGNTEAAPYINSLANEGLLLTRMRGVTHPSHPNYLELFSGDNQGIVYDESPAVVPLTTPNLGASLLAAGYSFTAYADALPTAGDTTVDFVDGYVRRHCPWVWWVTPNPGPNQLPPSAHQPFTAFPSDFSALPALCIVVPSNLHNMHDTGVADGDAWLSANMSAYAEWAKTHNSLLIVTWDEDGFTASNLIPTIFYGPGLRHGTNAGSWTHHNLLRTLEDMYGLPHSGRAANVPPILGVFSGEPFVTSRTYSWDTPGYDGANILVGAVSKAQPNAPASSLAGSVVGGAAMRQTLIRFPDVFGNAGASLPASTSIVSAKLVLTTADNSAGQLAIHRMLVPWSGASTWNSLDRGVSTDGVEAQSAWDFTAVPTSYGTAVVFDVTSSLNTWRTGAANYGWTIQTISSDVWTFYSAPGSNYLPLLDVSYVPASILSPGVLYIEALEAGGNATITLGRTGDISAPASVDFTTSPVTASADGDYTSQQGTLSWAAGDAAPKQILIPIIPDGTVEGNETFTVNFSNATGGVLDVSKVTVSITEAPIDVWRHAQFGVQANDSIATDTADPDGDGLVNLFEYAVGASPTAPDRSLQPQVIPGDYLTLSFRRPESATDLTYIVQVSGDLQTWQDGSTYSAAGSTPSNAITTEVSHSSGPVETIVVRDNVPNTAAARRYMRLKVIRN